MISNNSIKKNLIPWREIQKNNFVHWKNLADFLELSSEDREKILVKSQFPLNLPKRLAEKISKGTLEDPILKQFLPTQAELTRNDHFKTDPVGDQQCAKTSKLLHKYQGRVLLVVTSACAMHCRYCFRQNFSYNTQKSQFEEELALINADSSIKEVILSGGDPLSMSDEFLKALLENLAKIPHIKRIRFHTRFPVGIPERIDESFLEVIKDISKQIWFVLHINHPHELDEMFFQRIRSLQRLGIPVLNQAVLLKGVNDQVEVLENLFLTLSDHGILPYYLHQLDRVQGAHHFEVPEEQGKELMQELIKRLPGYAVPKYVKEIYQEPSKTPIAFAQGSIAG